MSKLKTLLSLLVLSCACAGLVLAQNANNSAKTADPIVGTWKLNLSQTKFSPVLMAAFKVKPPKEQTEVYKVVNGNIELAMTRIYENGSKTSDKLAWPVEGGEAGPAPSKDLSYIETHLGIGEWLVTYMQNGKQILTMHKLVSKDGKTMRQTIKGIDPQGKAIEQIQVLDKQ